MYREDCIVCGGSGWLYEMTDDEQVCYACEGKDRPEVVAERRRKLEEAIAKRPPLTYVQRLKNLEKFMQEKD